MVKIIGTERFMGKGKTSRMRLLMIVLLKDTPVHYAGKRNKRKPLTPHDWGGGKGS